jgi:hypothetical protein
LRKSVLLLLLCPFRVVNFVFLSLNPEKEHGLIPPGDLQVKVLRILFVLSSVLFLRSKQVLWDGLTLRS